MSISAPDGPSTIVDHISALYLDHIPPQNKARFLAILDSLSSNSQERGPDPQGVIAALYRIDTLLDWWRPLPDQQRKAKVALLRACEVQLVRNQRVRMQPHKVEL